MITLIYVRKLSDSSLFVNVDTFRFKRVRLYKSEAVTALSDSSDYFSPLGAVFTRAMGRRVLFTRRLGTEESSGRFRRPASIRSKNMKFAGGYPGRLSTPRLGIISSHLLVLDPFSQEVSIIDLRMETARRCNARPERKRIVARR